MSRRRPLRIQPEITTYKPDRDAAPVRRSAVQFACPRGHVFSVPFAATAQSPAFWTCPRHGIEESKRVKGPCDEVLQAKPKRTHLMIVLERRTVAELEALLAETLLAIRRQGGARPGCLRLGDKAYSFRLPS